MSIPASCKRLIEVDFPIGVVSEHSAREKSIRHGHPSTLHLWWARRPLAACRSVLMGLLLPDPCDKDCPADFKPKAWELLTKRFGERKKPDDAELRELLLKFIGELANWDNSTNALYLEIARGLVKAAHPEETPVVVDPFAGGGSIPLEALRLGCEAFASDLNPVACLILKTLLEDIPKYGNADFTLKDDKGKDVVIHGLANALRHIGAQVKQTADKELAEFYPIDPDGSQPIAYIWARTAQCEAAGCGAEIPLVRGFWLSKKPGHKRALRYTVQRPRKETPFTTFDIFTPESESALQNGTVHRADATCPCCQVVLPAARVRSQLSQRRGGANVQFDSKGNRIGGAILLAVVTLRANATGRFYRAPTTKDYAAVFAAQMAVARLPKGTVPDEPTPVGGGSGAGRAFSLRKYGIDTWGDLFTCRQQIAFARLAEIILRSSKTVSSDATSALLAMICSKLADRNNALVNWSLAVECPNQLFRGTSIATSWDFCESNIISGSSASIGQTLENIARNVEASFIVGVRGVSPQVRDACHSPLSDATSSVWFTDPPYYDAVPYSDLSDFFLVWLRRAMSNRSMLCDPFNPSNPLTPKDAEIVQDEARHIKGGVKDRDFFEREMGRAFAEGRRVLRDDGICCVVFAHKSTEGWEALLGGLLRGGWVITASWPITTERYSRVRARDSAALAGSVHLVCRPRPANAGSGDWGTVKAAMEKRIREWLPTLAKHGVRGADAVFSCLGPALESYSRYDKVLTAADHEVPLGGDPEATEPHKRGFLAYVFEAVSKEALRQVLGDAETEGFEEDSRMTALFLWTLQGTKTKGKGEKSEVGGQKSDGEEETEDESEDKPAKAKAGFSMPFDTFIRITRPMGIHYPTLEGRVIEIEKGVVRLLPVRERSEQLLGEAATKPHVDISLKDIRQMELGLGLERQTPATPLPTGRKKGGRKAAAAIGGAEIPFTTLDRIHRAMLLFTLGRSTLLRQVLEQDMRQGKEFERLALALNALYPDGCDERRMLEGVQAAMRGIKA